MSLFLFLIPAAIGGALTGYYGDFNCDNMNDYITENTKKYATIMKDEDILKEALNQYGIKYSDEKVLSTYINKGNIIFLKNNEGLIDLIFNGDFSDGDVKNFSEDLFEFYKRIVQERTYQKVMDYIKKEDLEYSENINNQSDVILTITLS